MAILFYVICTARCQWDFLMLSMNDFLPGCYFFFFFFAVVVIKVVYCIVWTCNLQVCVDVGGGGLMCG